ncbi:MAG: hypothetical protein JW891_10485 [Candidatus Lokiarchaeota archaeon]|nr:hypothetical protein [Candidatus Lokiarchaeota archaeon]
MKDPIILGLDIGGANTKAAIVSFKNGEIVNSYSCIEYFPFWENNLNDIPRMLKIITANCTHGFNIDENNFDFVCVSITAELSDAFQTKKEGILRILNVLEQVFKADKLRFISNKNEYLRIEEARKSYLSLAAANWVSTALFLGHYEPLCVLIDAGSTTIDIIPILDSLPVTVGQDDVSRIMHHELVYTGGLRATIPSITHFVPYKGKHLRISFEKFALIADVHRVLGYISEKEYFIETADNRTKSIEDCYARLARVICLDKETITQKELETIALYIYNAQLKIIKDELIAFLNELKERLSVFNKSDIKFVITGLAGEFLIKKVLNMLGILNIIRFEDVVHIHDRISSSALAVGCAFYYKSLYRG